ncbi:YciI family protein [Caulobacter sp. 602-2]|uniref:YciI family protein n=1 Tax=Caulobacter sp. 602-2 TaxID=2710887 RepID=A0A6G4QRZ8_9CAUL|nr:YciI family protein [Caulobacter sp. 602-2]NGM48426.1 YciI family protein [Caulobacter sp. 602-2]
MLYAILCYHMEDVVGAWSPAHDEAVMARLSVVRDDLAGQGRLSLSALLVDGPFAETKEQLLGFYLADCTDLEDAVAATRELAAANPGGCYEIRPVSDFWKSNGVHGARP